MMVSDVVHGRWRSDTVENWRFDASALRVLSVAEVRLQCVQSHWLGVSGI